MAKRVDFLQRQVELAQQRSQPCDQPLAGFGRRHATRGAVQQAHPHVLLERAHRDARQRRADAGAAPPGTGAGAYTQIPAALLARVAELDAQKDIALAADTAARMT
nr:hypothetical protein [Massilia sp. CCM 8734]